MVAFSDAARTAMTILVLATLTVGATWTYTVLQGPMSDPPPAYVEESGIFLVTYLLDTREVVLPPRAFSDMGEVRYPEIHIPYENVTSLDVILQVSMVGPSVQDRYDVTITDPEDESLSGSHPGPSPSIAGHERSASVILWARRAQPDAETYRTHDRDEALRWSAENRTDPSANGTWSALIQLSNPVIGREANASLVLRFTFFEAVVLPKTRATESAPTPAAPTNTTVTEPPQATSLHTLPRTFITPRAVDAAVDRGRTADRPF